MRSVSHTSVAASVRKAKERNPGAFCAHPRCLHRLTFRGKPTPCPKHPVQASESLIEAVCPVLRRES